MPVCSDVECCNNDRKGFSLFSFPVDAIRRAKWLINSGRSAWTRGRGARVCSICKSSTLNRTTEADQSKNMEHCDQSQAQVPGKQKRNALPSIFNFWRKTDKLLSKKAKSFLGSPNGQVDAGHKPTHITKVYELNIFKFLDNYKEHPCFWDKNHPDFRNETEMGKAEEDLLQLSGLASLADLRILIRSIHWTYNEEIQKLEMFKGTDMEDIYVPHLCWFVHADSFLKEGPDYVGLDEQLDTNSSTGGGETHDDDNATAPCLDTTAVSDDIDNDACEDDRAVLINVKEALKDETTSLEKTSQEDYTYYAISGSHSPQKDNLSNKTHHRIVLTEQDTSEKASQEDSSQAKQENCPGITDEFSMFGQQVASQLSKLPLDQALVLQRGILKLISAARP